jgi:hypothetical protein
MSDYQEGFRQGWTAAVRAYGIENPFQLKDEVIFRNDIVEIQPKRKPRKRPTSKKQKLLKTMTDKKWKTYKGKKTWIQIRAQVSRSQAYKKKARRL